MADILPQARLALLLACLLVAVLGVQGQQFTEQLLLRPLEDGNVFNARAVHRQHRQSSHAPAPCTASTPSPRSLTYIDLT